MNYGFYILLNGGEVPHAWFHDERDALAYVNDHGSPTFKLDIRPAPL